VGDAGSPGAGAESAQTLLAALEPSDFVLAAHHGRPVERLDQTMRNICRELGIADKITPHDLRRTNGTTITALALAARL
jgi:integrase